MTSLLTFNKCLIILSLLVYFLGYLWMTSSLFDMNMYCKFFSISKLINWVISDPLVYKDLKNSKFFHVVHMVVGLIMCLVLLKNRTHGFSMFTDPLHYICFYLSTECEFLDSHKYFVVLIYKPVNCSGIAKSFLVGTSVTFPKAVFSKILI